MWGKVVGNKAIDNVIRLHGFQGERDEINSLHNLSKEREFILLMIRELVTS